MNYHNNLSMEKKNYVKYGFNMCSFNIDVTDSGWWSRLVVLSGALFHCSTLVSFQTWTEIE